MNNFTANYAQRNQFSNPYYNVNPTSVTGATTTNNIIWVQGIEGAKAWQLNPNKKLAILYVVRDHFSNKTMNTTPVRATAPMTPTSTAI